MTPYRWPHGSGDADSKHKARGGRGSPFGDSSFPSSTSSALRFLKRLRM
jgi:hypothetical protein